MTERSESERAELEALEAELRRATYGKDGPTSPKILGLMVAAADAIRRLAAQDQKPVASDMLPADTIAWSFIDHHQAPVELHEALSDLVRRARNDNAPPDSGAGELACTTGLIERDIAAQSALARIRKVRDGYANQAKFADVEQASYFREFIRRLDEAVSPKEGTPQLLPDHGGADAVVKAQIATLAQRFWTIHPRELQDKGMTREEFYIREMTALVAALSKPAPVAANASAEARWRSISEDTSWLDGRDVVLLAHDMEVQARYCPGEWSDETPSSPREYSGAVWSCFDDQFQLEIEETSEDPSEWSHDGATHWRPTSKPPSTALPDHGGADAGVDPLLVVTYTNYRGETSVRRIAPKSIRFGSTEWHPEPQWLLLAHDTEKQDDREFALKDFGAKPAPAAANASAEAITDDQITYANELAEDRRHEWANASAEARLMEALELAYGLLWIVGCDRSTPGGNALSFARKALLGQLDKPGQGRGIAAARRVLNDEEAGCGGIRYSVSGRIYSDWGSRGGIRPSDARACGATSGDVAVVHNDGHPERAARQDGLGDALSAHPHASDCDKQGER